jgi:hypothetical protein
MGVLRPSTLLMYCGQVFLFLAGSLPATYFPCWCRWAQQRRPSHQHSNSIDKKQGAIDTDKMHIYWWYATNIEKTHWYWRYQHVDGLGVAVEMLCVVSSVKGLMSSVCVWTQVLLSPTASLFAFHWTIRWAFLLLVEGERCFFFWARLVISPVFSTSFAALIVALIAVNYYEALIII